MQIFGVTMRLKCNKCKTYVDDDLLKLILELNKVGLYTNNCCSGDLDGGSAYIQFKGDSIVGYDDYIYKGERFVVIRWNVPKYPVKQLYCGICGSELVKSDKKCRKKR